MQLEMQREVEERRKQKIEEEAKARQEYLEKMKNATIIDEIDDKPTKKCEFRVIIFFLNRLGIPSYFVPFWHMKPQYIIKLTHTLNKTGLKVELCNLIFWRAFMLEDLFDLKFDQKYFYSLLR